MRRSILTFFCAAGVFTGIATAADTSVYFKKEDNIEITRAEVLADLEMWNIAGLNKYLGVHGYSEITESTDYKNRFHQYLLLRNSAEYQIAIHRLKSKSSNK